MIHPFRWHPWFHAFIRHLYFDRVRVLGGERLNVSGPVLALCLHRNGAVDGFIYRQALPEVQFMVKAGLRKSLMGRLFFDGLEVTRKEDGGKSGNLEAINECLDFLSTGGWLGIFPEGTSGLGPRHLPFKSGAARIALRHLEEGRPLTVLPLGIHYERAWAFRSRVEIVAGEAIALDLPETLSTPGARLVELKRRISTALESVGTNFPDAATQDLAQKLAYIATLGTCHQYFDVLKSMEQGLPEEAKRSLEELETATHGKGLLRHQGVPLFPLKWPWAYALAAVLMAPIVLTGFILNLPPVLIACWAGRKFPDDTNVITLWRILTGVPLLILWAAACCLVGLVAGPWWSPLPYIVLTWLGIRGWYRLKKLAVIAWNGTFHYKLRPLALAVHRAMLISLP